MNVNCAYILYIHTVYESYSDVEWIKVTENNILFKDSKCVTHVIPIKKLVNFSVTQ